MSFYMTLPCDASPTEYPTNKAGKFTIQLAREVALDREYEVGLSEVVFPEPKFKLDFYEPIVWEEDAVEKQQRVTGRELLLMIGKWSSERPTVKDGYALFTMELVDGYIHVTVAPKCKLIFNRKNNMLRTVLGFDGYTEVLESPDHVSRTHKGDFKFGSKVALHFVYIYCDVVEHNYVGDSMVPCLRTIPINMEFMPSNVLRFENPHYLPVRNSRFSTVTVEFTNELGEVIKFKPGLSLVKLHFRPRKLY